MTAPVNVGKEVLVPETTMPDVRATDPVDVGKEVFLPDHETAAGVTPDLRATDPTGSHSSEAFSVTTQVEDTIVSQFLLSLIVRNKVFLRIK